jgi:hypothetical protein
MATNPFEGRWAVQLFELHDAEGNGIGLPFGSRAVFAITGEGDLLRVMVEETEDGTVPGRPTVPVFDGQWRGGEVASMSARWLDSAEKFFYQIVAVAGPGGLTGGYFRVSRETGPDPEVDSEGAGSWLGTGPIMPLERERG